LRHRRVGWLLPQDSRRRPDVRDRFWGWPSEKTPVVLDGLSRPSAGEDIDADGEPTEKKKKKRRTSGRRSADEYTSAEVIDVPHEELEPRGPCPDDPCDGKVYPLPEPAKVVRITGVSPLHATRYDLQRLRCNLCGTVYTAERPGECCDPKHDETAAAMIGVLRYGYGLPHNRIEKLCGNLGVPFPSSTQWDVINGAADALMPVFNQLVLKAAQRDVITIDDTSIKVIEINAELAQAYQAVKAKVEAGELPKSALRKQRTGGRHRTRGCCRRLLPTPRSLPTPRLSPTPRLLPTPSLPTLSCPSLYTH
jgi:transposase